MNMDLDMVEDMDVDEAEASGDLFDKLKSTLRERKYCLEGEIGKNSHSPVVKAKNANVDCETSRAVKIVSWTNDDRDPYPRRELEILKQPKKDLWTKNIVVFYEFWEICNPQSLIIHMEHCFANLVDFINNPPFITFTSPTPLWKHVFLQILNGLSVIHRIGWVHRNIHPGNILIAYPEPKQIKDIVVKIADFDLAREIGSIIRPSFALTVAPKLPGISNVQNKLFMAPELEKGYYDYKVDLYSAGTVLYLLSRNFPDKKQWPDEIREYRNGNRGQYLSRQDDMLINLIDCLMKKDPDERPTADQALKYVRGDSRYLNGKEFLVTQEGHETYYHCKTTDNTLESLKNAIKEYIIIQDDVHILKQETTSPNTNEIDKIASDKDVQKIFAVAEKHWEGVSIVVTTPVVSDDET